VEIESEIKIAVRDTLDKRLSIVSDESIGSKENIARSKSILLSGTYSRKKSKLQLRQVVKPRDNQVP